MVKTKEIKSYVIGILLASMIALALFNLIKINQIYRELSETQNEIENINEIINTDLLSSEGNVLHFQGGDLFTNSNSIMLKNNKCKLSKCKMEISKLDNVNIEDKKFNLNNTYGIKLSWIVMNSLREKTVIKTIKQSKWYS